MTLAELKAARAAALARAEAANSKAADGALDAASQTEFDTAMADVDRLAGDIAATEAKADAAATRSAALARHRTAAPRSLESSVTPAVISGVRERVLEDPKRGYASVGHFAADIVAAMTPGHAHSNDALRALSGGTGMNMGDGSAGGFLVPPEFSTAIWDGLNTASASLLGMCDKYNVQGDSLTMNANAETSRANGSRYGGVRGYWIAEAAQATASRPTFRQLKLEPQQMAVLIYGTDKLLRNAPALASFLSKAAGDEINFMVGDAILNGTGVGKPRGIMASGSLITVAKEASQAAASLLQANVSKMWARLHARSRANSVWLINQELDPTLDGLNIPIKNVAGTENVGGISNMVYNADRYTLKGRPIVPIEYCAALGSLGDIVLADMSGYAAGLRSGIDAQTSMHLRFDYAETAFRFLFDVDGQTWLNSPITPFKGTSTLSQFVTLATRA